MNILASGKSVDVTVRHKIPVTRSETIGMIPSDVFLSHDQTPDVTGLAHNRPVTYEQPLVEGGAPVMLEVSQRIQARASSPILSGLVGGFCGGVTGFIAGGLVSMLTGNGAFLMGGAALGTATGGGLGALSAVGARVRVVEKEFPIEQRAMTGVEVQVSPGKLDGQPGFFHRFEPRLQRTPLGSYTQPILERYREGSSS